MNVQPSDPLPAVEGRLKEALEATTDCVVVMDAAFRILYVNRRAAELARVSPADIIGLTHWEAWPASVGTEVERRYRHAMETGEPQEFESHYAADHLDAWVEIHAHPSENGLTLFYRDITARKREREELARLSDESERRKRLYETVLSNTPDLVYVWGLDHRFLYANEALLRMWGKTAEEAVGKHCLELGYEPWHAEMHDREIEQVIATKKPIRGVVPFSGTNGRRMYDYILVPVIGEEGSVEAVAGTTRDVTERMEAEEAVRSSEKRYRTLFDAIDEGFCEVEILFEGDRAIDFYFKEVNPAFERLTGLSSADALGPRTVRELVPGIEDFWIETYGRVALTGQAESLEAGSDAMGRWFEARASRVGEPGSRRVAVVFSDVTERRRTQAALQESEERMRRSLNIQTVGVVYFRLDGPVVDANTAFQQISGWNLDELRAKAHWEELTFPEFREVTGRAAKELAENGEATPYKKEMVRPDGSRWWGLFAATRLTDEGPNSLCVKFVLDDTVRHEAERERDRLTQELRSERERLISLVKDAPAFVALLDGPEFTFTYVNDAYYRLVGNRPIVGLTLKEALPEIVAQGYDEILRRVMETGEPYLVRERLVMLRVEAGGPLEERYVDLVYQPALDPEGNVTGVLTHGNDVTEQVRSRKAVIRLNEELEDTVRQRTEDLVFRNQELERFTYAVSHDMRTPLRAIVASASLVLEDEAEKVSPEGQARLQRLSMAAIRMSRLVDDLLEHARLGRAQISREPVRMAELARSVAGELPSELAGCDVSVQIGEELVAHCDPRLIGMALQNLFENACKYTLPGTSPVVCFGSERMDGERVFFVRDEGIGFDMAYAGKLYQPFERLHREEYAGTGIGLANVKRAVERHGGRVWAESGGPGRGATFFFTLEPRPAAVPA